MVSCLTKRLFISLLGKTLYWNSFNFVNSFDYHHGNIRRLHNNRLDNLLKKKDITNNLEWPEMGKWKAQTTDMKNYSVPRTIINRQDRAWIFVWKWTHQLRYEWLSDWVNECMCLCVFTWQMAFTKMANKHKIVSCIKILAEPW